MLWKKERKEDSDVLKRFSEMLVSFERVIKTAERIYCSKCWTEMSEGASGRLIYRSECLEKEAVEENIKVVVEMLTKRIAIDEKHGYNTHSNGMQEALKIVKEVMKYNG
jgi:hypothetical protein